MTKSKTKSLSPSTLVDRLGKIRESISELEAERKSILEYLEQEGIDTAQGSEFSFQRTTYFRTNFDHRKLLEDYDFTDAQLAPYFTELECNRVNLKPVA